MTISTTRAAGAASLLLLATLAACSGRSSAPEGSAATAPVADPQRAACVMKSPYLQVGAGLDAPGRRLEVDRPATGSAAGACRGNRQFVYGAGLHDITGPVANTGGSGWENLFQILNGLHQRQYARAFAIESPCNGRRVMFISADVGLIWASLRNGVLAAVAADPVLAAHYGPDNLMLTATHTHQGPAGYSHEDGGNLFHYGYDDLNYRTIVAGIVAAIGRAHANLQAHPQSGPISLAVGELLNTNVNRSLPAFALNPEAERQAFVDRRGQQVTVDKRFVQLNLVREGGSAVGVINWFGVHPTILGPELGLVSSDHKGYASLGFERIMRTRYEGAVGADDFVAAFAQTNEGDASPNLLIEQHPWPDPARGGGRDPYESNAIAGTKQLAKALELFSRGQALTGPVDYRYVNVQMDQVTVSDPAVLAGLQHPAELDAEVKRTCAPALGISFGAGAEDGPGPAQEGVRCDASPDVLAAALADATAIFRTPLPPSNPYQLELPPNLVSAALLCQADQIPGADFSCHAEKPVFLPAGQAVLPFQLFRIGNLALIGLPWEVTTVAARRLRRDLLEVLAPAGIDTVVIAGLANEYVNYLTTREEYSSQQYEGASTLFGPWTLAAVQQESRRLAQSLRDGSAAPAGPATPPDATPTLLRPTYQPSDLPGAGTAFGDLLLDVPARVAAGDTVRAEFQAGHPRNDLRTGSSYAYVERQRPDGRWEVVVTDRLPELRFVWKAAAPSPAAFDPPVTGESIAEIVWEVPRDTPAGTYRLRHDGAAQTAQLPKAQYTGVSGPFTIDGPAADCP